jgi:Cu2+-exporting ATPase
MDHSHAAHHENVNQHDKHAGHHTADFLRKFWISLVLTVPIFFYSEMAKEVLNIRGPEFVGWQYVLLLLGSIVYFYCGWVFLQSAYKELEARLPGMMTLIAIAITAAYTYSVWSILSGQMHELMFELASLITIMLLGHWIEMKSVAGAQGALKELSKLLPDKAEVIRGTRTEIIMLADLKVGDLVLIKPGSKVPGDGTIIEGQSDVTSPFLQESQSQCTRMSAIR